MKIVRMTPRHHYSNDHQQLNIKIHRRVPVGFRGRGTRLWGQKKVQRIGLRIFRGAEIGPHMSTSPHMRTTVG
jgi:hypothetical protein